MITASICVINITFASSIAAWHHKVFWFLSASACLLLAKVFLQFFFDRKTSSSCFASLHQLTRRFSSYKSSINFRSFTKSVNSRKKFFSLICCSSNFVNNQQSTFCFLFFVIFLTLRHQLRICRKRRVFIESMKSSTVYLFNIDESKLSHCFSIFNWLFLLHCLLHFLIIILCL